MEYTYTEDQLPIIATQILENLNSKLICFYGEMGAGKTTLIKAMVGTLGGGQKGSSPTFGIVNEYAYKDDSLLGYHFDFYRIEDESEALDIGFEEYLDQGVWIFIEWPEKIPSLIPESANRLLIEVIDDKTRKLILES